jgi:hypothetical protein
MNIMKYNSALKGKWNSDTCYNMDDLEMKECRQKRIKTVWLYSNS